MPFEKIKLYREINGSRFYFGEVNTINEASTELNRLDDSETEEYPEGDIIAVYPNKKEFVYTGDNIWYPYGWSADSEYNLSFGYNRLEIFNTLSGSYVEFNPKGLDLAYIELFGPYTKIEAIAKFKELAIQTINK